MNEINRSNPGEAVPAATPAVPFDIEKLDAILDRAGIDALIISSKHNLQYMLGGYRFFFFASPWSKKKERFPPSIYWRWGWVEVISASIPARSSRVSSFSVSNGIAAAADSADLGPWVSFIFVPP